MYLFNKLYVNIESFIVNANNFYIKYKSKVLTDFNGNITCSSVYDYFLLENYIIYNTEDRCIVKNIKTGIISEFIEKIGLQFSNSTANNIALVDVLNNTQLFILKTDLNSEAKILDNYNWEFLYLIDVFLLLHNKKTIKSLSLLTGEQQWETNLGLYGEIRKILGVQSRKIWVSMDRCGENKDKNSVLALDVNTGQILYQSPPEYDLSDWFVELIPEHNSILSIYGKMSTRQADSPLVEINATTGAVMRNQRIESLYRENLKIGFWKFLDDKIYFTANKDTLHGRHIGILDYNTLEILWQTEIKDLRGTFKDFQVTDNKIYALDTGNQLHIFEKE